MFCEYLLEKIMCIGLFLKFQMSGFIISNKDLKIDEQKQTLPLRIIHQQRSTPYSTSKLDVLHPQITPYTYKTNHHQQQHLAIFLQTNPTTT